MNLKQLANEVLDQNLKSLVQQEREVLSEILVHIAEVDRRKFFLKMAYPNLFAYLTEHLGYSAGSAQRRIDAARLLSDVPDLTEKLESGELSLAQVSLAQKSLRQKNCQVSRDLKQSLIEDLTGLSLEESQIKVAQALDIKIQDTPKVHHQRDESVRFEVTLTKEQWQKLNRMRELLSNSLPCWNEVLEYVTDLVIEKKTKVSPRTKEAKKTETKAATGNEAKAQEPKAQKSKSTKQVTAAKKEIILQRDQCCQYEDPITKKKCQSKWNLQTDHMQPQWAGGGHELENLRILCGNHNRYVYREQAGIH